MPVRHEPSVRNGSTAKSVDDKAVTSVLVKVKLLND